MVLLKEACTCAIASSTFLRTFLRAGFAPCAAAAACCVFCFGSAMTNSASHALRATVDGVAATQHENTCSNLDLAWRRVHLHRLFARTFACAGVRARPLAPHRQA